MDFAVRPFLFVLTIMVAQTCTAQAAYTTAQAANAPIPASQFRPADPAPQTGTGGRSQAVDARQQPATPASIPAAPLGKDYRVGPNDLIEVEIFEMENLKRVVRVNAAGMVSLPLIGSVQVAGLTPTEVEQRVAEKYSEKYLQNPQVSVFVKEFTSERITVEGAVAHPGIFPLTGKLTLLRVLAMAGGFGPIANSSEVMIYRVNDKNVREVAVFDIEQIRAGKAEDPPIKGDDMIVVQRDKMRVVLKDSLLRDIVDSINPFSMIVPRSN